MSQLTLPTPPNTQSPWSKKERRDYVAAVMTEIIKLKEKPTKEELLIVAQDIVAGNRQQLPDKWFEGSAVSAMLTILTDKRDNMCRNPQLQQMKRSLADDSEEATSKRKPKQSHGCLRWQPARTGDEEDHAAQEFLKQVVSQPQAQWNLDYVQENMRLSFPSQRLRLNAIKPLSTLNDDWPILLTKYGITTHFQLMQGFHPIDSVRSNCEKKIPPLVAHLLECKAAKKRANIESIEEGDAMILGAILLAMAFFEEEPSHLFVLQEVRL